MQVAILNDTHCGIRRSSEVFIDQEKRFYEEVFFPLVRERGIKHIIHLGDVFDDRKSINFKALNSYRTNFLNVLREEKLYMDVIPGNHDTYWKNTNDLNSLKELLGHFMNEVCIVDKPRVMTYDGLRVALIPWINKENYSKTISFIKKCKADIAGGHLELMGFDVLRGIEATQGMDPETFSRFELVISGHYHTKSQRGNIMYLGAPMEYYWNDVGDPKYFHVLDTATREIEAIHNPLTMFARVVYDDVAQSYKDFDFSQYENKFVKIVVQNKTDNSAFDRFVDGFQRINTHDLKVAETYQEWSGINVGDSDVLLEDTASLLTSYIESVDTNLDINRLKQQAVELLKRAQTFEVE